LKAAIRKRYGSPNQIKIQQIEKPIPEEKEVLVRVYATTVNRTDCANLTAKPFIMRFVLGLFKPRRIILGTDFAGVVLTTGKNVTSFNIGDKVFGFRDIGIESQAEYLTTAIENIYPIPDNIDFKHAAASLEGAHYAYSFLHKVNIETGQHIFINGGTGGIGSALLQLVRQYDVKITATCNKKNISLIKSLGADKVIDYTQKDFTDEHDKYDYIFDTVGKSTFGKCKPLLKENGAYISSELGPYSQNIFYSLLTLKAGKKVIFPVPDSHHKSIPYIIGRLETGKFMPVIDREYLFKDISDAYNYVMKGQKTGNVIIDLRNENTTT
jgi:NADPH:quinone reductase-like Zn-dependent oxidoreductase